MLRWVLFALGGLSLLVPCVWGQPTGVGKDEKRAPTIAPSLFRASAAEGNGAVVVQVSCPCVRLPYDSEGKRLPGTVYMWEEIKPLTLGKEIAAYDLKGQPLGKEAVMKALTKPTMAVCLVRRNQDAPERPDPVYLEMFREGDGRARLPRQGYRPVDCNKTPNQALHLTDGADQMQGCAATRDEKHDVRDQGRSYQSAGGDVRTQRTEDDVWRQAYRQRRYDLRLRQRERRRTRSHRKRRRHFG